MLGLLESLVSGSEPLELTTLFIRIFPKATLYRSQTFTSQHRQKLLEVLESKPDHLDLSALNSLASQSNEHRTAFFGTAHPFEAIALAVEPMILQTIKSSYQMQTRIDLARIAAALERHRLAGDRYPDRLEALTPQWIDTLPIDRITGNPLIYRIKEDGTPIVYSRGWNGTDDGGHTHRQARESLDWVWQYTHPEHNPNARFVSNKRSRAQSREEDLERRRQKRHPR